MTLKQYQFCIQELQEYTDADAYVSDIALSSIWGDGPDYDIPAERIDQLRTIFQAASRTVPDIAAIAGLNITNMSARFAVPYRTMQNWFNGSRECILSTRLLMQECLGLYKPPID